MPSPSDQELLTQASRLQASVTAHKAAIRRHRQQLQTTKAALLALDAECQRRGIRLIVHHGEGASAHGRIDPVRA